MAEPAPKSQVVYLGHIPHGFYEKEMTKFLSQFGEISRLRLARARNTAKSQHYAFIEFQFPEVAEIVAKTMNNYFMFDKYLVCHVVKPEDVHEGMFLGAGKKYKPVPWRLINRKVHNAAAASITPEKAELKRAAAIKRDEERKKRIAEAGIDYEFTTVGERVAASKRAKAAGGEDEASAEVVVPEPVAKPAVKVAEKEEAAPAPARTRKASLRPKK